jgi:hypothetical protein
MQPDDRPDAAAPLVDSDDLSRELVQLCTRFSDDLFAWLDKAIAREQERRRVPLKVAVSQVAYALTDRLLYPTYVHHAGLIPEALRQPAARAQ